MGPTHCSIGISETNMLVRTPLMEQLTAQTRSIHATNIQQDHGSHPPSTLRAVPVVYDEASLSKNSTERATSSGVPTRGITVGVGVNPPWMAVALSNNGV